MSLFPDLTPLIKKTEEFTKVQQQIITLLEQSNQINTQILIQLGGKMPDQLNSLSPNSALLENQKKTK